MSELRELYQELIIDHGRHPRNFGDLEKSNFEKEGFNPVCGDRLTVYLLLDKSKIIDLSFKGTGCAISVASASLMTEVLKGKTLEEAEVIFQYFHQLVTGKAEELDEEKLGKLLVLSGVAAFPSRVKCATLAWHTVMAALHQEQGVVSTE